MADDQSGVEDRQGAIDWAYSVQKRHADRLAADLVTVVRRRETSSNPENPHVKRVRATMAALGVDWDGVFTPPEPLHDLDDAWVRGTIDPLVDRLCAVLPAEQAAKLDKLVLSSLPSGEVSALCATNTWDKFHYVFMDADLLMFCQLTAKIVALCIDPMLDNELSVAKVESRKTIEVAKSDVVANKVFDLFVSTVVAGAVRGAKPWVPPPRPYAASVVMAEAMTMFVVAHELSHVLAGHFERAEGHESVITGDAAQTLAFAHDEFEADGMGVTLALGALRRDGVVSVLEAVAPYAFLKSIDYLHQVQAMFRAGDDAATSSHPPPAERAARLRKIVAEMLGHEDVLEPMFTRIDQVFFQMTREATPAFQRMVDAGVQPRPRERLSPPGQERPAILGIQPMLIDREGRIDDWRETLGVLSLRLGGPANRPSDPLHRDVQN